MKPKVYIETSVVSYLSGRLSRDVVIVQTKGKVADFVEDCGYEPPLVCSPDELFGELS